jgi:hypothetical protein
MRSSTPITINRTLSGNPFIVANPWCEPYLDGNGNVVPSLRRRKKISIWPVSKGKDGMMIMDTERSVQNGLVGFTGSWSPSSSIGGYNYTDYYNDGNSGKGTKKVRYTPNIPQTGIYSVYMIWAASSNRATNVPVSIIHSAGTSSYIVNQTANGGKWYLLGQYTFNQGTSGYAEIKNDGTNGYVVADAVCFVPGSAPNDFSDMFIGSPTFTFDWTTQFGTTPNGSPLWADHPNGEIIRLKDGFHSIMCTRIWVRDEFSGYVVPTPQSGCWIEDIKCDDDANVIPIWRFSIPGDFSGDGIVNFKDLKELSDHWLYIGTNLVQDIYRDNIINFRDFSVFSKDW